MNIDEILKRYGYAPGNYFFKCCRCQQQHIGDKRALTCKECATECLMNATEDKFKQIQEKGNQKYMKFEVYSKDNCIYCTKIKDLLAHHGLVYEEKSLSSGYTKEEIQERVGEDKKINIVPQVFVNGDYLGGYLEVVEFLAYDRHIS